MAIDVQFTDLSKSGPSGPVVSWAWTFGDGGTSVSQNPLHSYAAAGTYTASLTVTGTGGDGTSSTSHSVTVTDTPAPLAATFTHTVATRTVTFTDTSTAGPSGPITGWAWNFGDAATSTSQNPVHTYAAGGTYDIVLTVTGTAPDGPATITVSIPVVPSPPAPTAYRPYISTSAFNILIPASPPIHPGSSNMISTLNNWLFGSTDSRREWLGPTNRTAYYRGNTSLLPSISMYANNNGWVGAGPFTMGMPSWMATVIGPTCQSGDGNVVVVDSSTGDVWECWHTTPPGYTARNSGFPSTRWNCSAYRHWPADTTTRKGYNLGTYSISNPPGTSGSKIQLSAGMLVPDDFADCFAGSDPGTAVPHMMRLDSFCGSNGANYPVHVPPATMGDGAQAYGIPAGARVQLDPALNVGTWPSVNAKREPWRSALKKILRGLQQYGVTQVDGYGAAGYGDIDCVGADSVVRGGDNYAVGYKFPWEVAGYGWYHLIGGNGIPADLMPHFRVIDWTIWSGV